jgi:hypothetical protein
MKHSNTRVRRRTATRYDKLAANYLPFVQLTLIGPWLCADESRPGLVILPLFGPDAPLVEPKSHKPRTNPRLALGRRLVRDILALGVMPHQLEVTLRDDWRLMVITDVVVIRVVAAEVVTAWIVVADVTVT